MATTQRGQPSGKFTDERYDSFITRLEESPTNRAFFDLLPPRLVASKMREIRAAGKVVGLDRIAVMAALNLSHEVLLIRNASTQVDQQMLERLRAMNERLNQAVGTDNTTH